MVLNGLVSCEGGGEYFVCLLTVGLVDQTVDVTVWRLVTIGLAERPVMRGRHPATATGRWRGCCCGLHHAERGVRAHVVVHILVATARIRRHLVPGIVSHPQRGERCRVFDPFVHLVTGFPFDRIAVAATVTPSSRVLRTVFSPVRQGRKRKKNGVN